MSRAWKSFKKDEWNPLMQQLGLKKKTQRKRSPRKTNIQTDDVPQEQESSLQKKLGILKQMIQPQEEDEDTQYSMAIRIMGLEITISDLEDQLREKRRCLDGDSTTDEIVELERRIGVLKAKLEQAEKKEAASRRKSRFF